jgi:multidrug efflux pump subunit AcrB
VAAPGVSFSFAGILGDLIGDLMYAPKPIEIRLYSTDVAWLEKTAPEIEAELKQVDGVVDTFDGVVITGPSLTFRLRPLAAQRFGLDGRAVAAAVDTAMLGERATSVLEGDRIVAIRVRAEPESIDTIAKLRDMPLRTPDGRLVKLSQVADLVEEPGQLQLRRDDLRQDVAVVGRLEGRDLGSAMTEIRQRIEADARLPAGTVEFAGLFQQQQEAFVNLVLVLAMAILLVFTVLLVEFRGFAAPIAIVSGAVLALFGTVVALWVTGTSLNVVSFLGAIIGIGIVAKNGILMLDFVDHLRADGLSLEETLVRSGQRRLRPVLMTSLAAALGMLPLAYGIGAGADMLKPLAIAVIGALAISVVLSLVATPTIYFVLRQRGGGPEREEKLRT